MQLACIRQRDNIPGVEVPNLESSRVVRRVIEVAEVVRGREADLVDHLIRAAHVQDHALT